MVVTRRGLAARVALPADLLAHVARMSCSARLLILMQSVSRAWREAVLAVHEELWKLAVLTKFPRVKALLAASPQSDEISFRDIYRSQSKAERLPPQPVEWRRSPPKPTCKLNDFVFTLELKSGDALLSWTGQLRWTSSAETTFRNTSKAPLWQAGAPCPLSTIVQRWVADPNGAAEVHLSVFVTSRMRTVRIMHERKLARLGGTTSILNLVRNGRAELPIKHDTSWMLLDGPDTPLHRARRHAAISIHVPTGRFLMTWDIEQAPEQGSDDIEAAPMTRREALVYLERCVPWPERLTPAMNPDFTHSRFCCCSRCFRFGSDSGSD